MEETIADILKANISNEAFEWLQQKAALIQQETKAQQLNLSFTAVPRKTGKQTVDEKDFDLKETPLASVEGWTVDRLARVWLLMNVKEDDKENYIKKIKPLFLSAEMNELVALYSALPVYAYPEEWKLQCAEGIRSNIGLVLEAIMYDNPFPSKYLDEGAWNQLVMKAFFTDKDVNRIIGLDERANKKLAEMVVDYAHERWAAHRTVNVQLWRLVAPFIDENNFQDVEKIFESENETERKAAALTCYQSNYQPAKNLPDKAPELKKAIESNELNWRTL